MVAGSVYKRTEGRLPDGRRVHRFEPVTVNRSLRLRVVGWALFWAFRLLRLRRVHGHMLPPTPLVRFFFDRPSEGWRFWVSRAVWTYKCGGEVPPDSTVTYVSLVEVPMSREEIQKAAAAIDQFLARRRTVTP